MSKTEKWKAADIAVAAIEETFGKGAIMRLGRAEPEPVAVVSRRSLGLDLGLGVNELPRGRVIEVFGPESSGKTTLALHATAEMQRGGGIAAFVDAEHALGPCTSLTSYLWPLAADWARVCVLVPPTPNSLRDLG